MSCLDERSTYRLAAEGQADACFFRSGVEGDGRKALVQITERCNLHCAHCFVSATRHGADMRLDDFTLRVLPRLVEARVLRLTLTGGEPFAHPEIIGMCSAAAAAGVSVGICTNATTITDQQIFDLVEIGFVHLNVSFDGFSQDSHGRFRGNPDSFDVTVDTTRRLAAAGLLQGLLSTPNALSGPEEYRALANFARELGARYLLMNPLSSFGRGVRSHARLAAESERMEAVLDQAAIGAGDELELVPIRFPNRASPLSACVAGDIVYVFVDGAVAVCPYLVFAARTPASCYDDSEFLMGNVIDAPIARALDAYRFHDRFEVGANPTCQSCALTESCGKGCPAAVVARGEMIGQRDVDPCPLP